MDIMLSIGMAVGLLLGPAGGGDDSGLKNPDFEDGDVGAAPAGWVLTTTGGKATVSADNPRRGKHCVRVGLGDRVENPPRFQVLLQQLDAAPYRGKTIRFKAAVRIDGAGPLDQAMLWLRVDRAGGRPGFFENMGNRPIRGKTWGDYEIVGDVAKDAELIVLGMIVSGTAPAWIDDVSLKAEGDAPTATAEAPRALAGRGLQNLIAFTRLLGYVRHFHPSDQAAEADWERLAVEGIARSKRRAVRRNSAHRLQEFVRPVAPTVRVFVSGAITPLPEELAACPERRGRSRRGVGASWLRRHRHGLGNGLGLPEPACSNKTRRRKAARGPA